MQPTDTLYGVVKNGVLTLSGYVISIREDMGCLLIRDGIKGAEIEHRFLRASCPFSRLMVVRSEGYMTLAAMRWLHEAGVSLVHLDYDGTPVLTSVPRANSPARLRRTQAALSVETRLGSSIARSLIEAKIAGQIANLQWLGFNSAASEAVPFAQRLEQHPSAPDLLGIEGRVTPAFRSLVLRLVVDRDIFEARFSRRRSRLHSLHSSAEFASGDDRRALAKHGRKCCPMVLQTAERRESETTAGRRYVGS